MIDQAMLLTATNVPSMEDDPWFQAANPKTRIAVAGDSSQAVVFAPKSLTETLFWITIASETWQIVVRSANAAEFREAIETLGPAQVMRLIGK